MKNKKAIEKLINQIYFSVYKKIFNTKIKSTVAAKGKIHVVEDEILKLKDSKLYQKFAEEFAKKLAKKGLSNQRGIWRKYFNAAKQNGLIGLTHTYSAFEKKLMRETIKHNFKMIKSIPDHILSVYKQDYTKTLIESVAEGKLGRGAFFKQLQAHSHKNAGVIARTETSKLQTFILQTRSEEIGVVAYIWRASNDVRTRQSHKDMNDVVVFWRKKDDEKPKLQDMFGHAGEFPNCRCTPQPIIRIDDLTKSQYKVYDYRKHKVINMKKHKLHEVLKAGELT